MEAVSSIFALEKYGLATPLYLTLALVSMFLLWRPFARGQLDNARRPPMVDEKVPFISNIWQYMTSKKLFLDRITEALQKAPVVACQLGPAKVYFITGGEHIAKLFRSSSTTFTSEPWMLVILKNVAGYADEDIAKLAKDKTGVLKAPNLGFNKTNLEERIWHMKHNLHNEFLASHRGTEALSSSFQRFFSNKLDVFPIGKGEDVSIYKFIRHAMASAAVCSVVGQRILTLNPGFIEKLWQYDWYAESLAFGIPAFLNKKGLRAREEFLGMCLKWYDECEKQLASRTQKFSEGSKEPFGSSISRELGRWGKGFGFTKESMAGVYAFLFLGLNTNTVPVCAWALMEIIKDPELTREIQEEVSLALVTDPGTKALTFDAQKLSSLPLLQSVYTESLRLHMSLNVTRTATEDVTIAGYTLPKGCTIQAPTQISHREESVWASPGHPASEFWAHRHVRNSGTGKASFSIEDTAGSFFPYGGGAYLCPGRNFAKQEILLVIAMVITKFDIELLGWTSLDDDSASDRPAQNDPRYAGAGSVPPDREMKVRWRRTC